MRLTVFVFGVAISVMDENESIAEFLHAPFKQDHAPYQLTEK